jgi:hypothetical protein
MLSRRQHTQDLRKHIRLFKDRGILFKFDLTGGNNGKERQQKERTFT